MYNYPYQISNAFSRNIKKKITTTLGIEAHFALEDGKPDGAEESSINPLEIHAGYSRFTCCLIRKDETKNSRVVVSGNIPAKDDADRIIARTRACENILAEYELKKNKPAEENGSENNTPAYTVALTMGTLKGKTPAMALVENANNRKALIEQYNFLKEKLKDFPKNQVQMDAIREAVTLFDKGQLNMENAAETAGEGSIEVYSANFKPLKSTLDADGKVLVYSISIKCYPGKNYPYEFTIRNMRCHWDGQVAHPAKGDPNDEVSIFLTEDKWAGIVGDMERSLSAFTLCNYIKQVTKADNANRLNRLKAVKEGEEKNSHTA